MPPRKRKPKIALETTETFEQPSLVQSEVLAVPTAPVRVASPAWFKRPLVSRSLLLAILFGSVSSAVYFYREYHNAVLGKADTKEIEAVVGDLAEIVDLPTDEVPTFATVTDASKLTEQSFFSRSKNGDKVLIYSKNGLAYLYRPENGKLINIAPIGTATASIPNSTVATDTAPSSQAVLGATTNVSDTKTSSEETSENAREEEKSSVSMTRIVLLNGSTKVGATHTFESDFLAGEQNIEILDKQPAVHNDYQRTIIVDVTKKATALAESLAQEAGSSVEELPVDEKIPEAADIAVIIGNDRN